MTASQVQVAIAVIFGSETSDVDLALSVSQWAHS